MRPQVPSCPRCGLKLPYDRNARSKGGIYGEIERLRVCGCGYSRHERVTTIVTEYYPESGTTPEPRRRGEGGMRAG